MNAKITFFIYTHTFLLLSPNRYKTTFTSVGKSQGFVLCFTAHYKNEAVPIDTASFL